MPGWTVTTWEAGVDWAAIAVVQEFVDALNERSQVIGGEVLLADVLKSKASTCTVVGTTLTAEDSIFTADYVGHTVDIADIGTRTIAAYTSGTVVTLSADGTCEDKGFILNGTDIQAASFWKTFQDFIVGHWSDFVKSHDAGVKRDRDWFGESPQHETVEPGTLFRYQSLADLFAAAGLATETFRRYQDHPDDAGVDLEGTIAIGDILGHWVWEDLMKLFNAMVWTWKVPSWIADGQNNRELGYSTVGGDLTWQEAYAAASADWGNNTDQVDGLAPMTETLGQTFGADTWAAIVQRDISKGQITVPDDLTRDVTWYAFTGPREEDYSTFDAQDDTGILDDKWTDWLTDAPATASTTVKSSAYLAPALTEPPNCGDGPTQELWEYFGWIAKDKYAVVHWDRSGGFSSY